MENLMGFEPREPFTKKIALEAIVRGYRVAQEGQEDVGYFYWDEDENCIVLMLSDGQKEVVSHLHQVRNTGWVIYQGPDYPLPSQESGKSIVKPGKIKKALAALGGLKLFAPLLGLRRSPK